MFCLYLLFDVVVCDSLFLIILIWFELCFVLFGVLVCWVGLLVWFCGFVFGFWVLFWIVVVDYLFVLCFC